MPEPFETVLYVARLSAAESGSLFQHDEAFPGADLKARLLRAVEQVSLDRLVRAECFLAVAERLRRDAGGDEELLRTAVSRAYFSAHHEIRAICLRQNAYDPDGHEESINALRKLLNNNDFRNRSGLSEDVADRVAESRRNRHVADYSPYAEQRSSKGPERLTDNDWERAADFNLTLARDVLQAAVKLF